MNQPQTFADFIKEVINRFGAPSPKIFKILGDIGLVASGLGFLPNWLVEAGIDVPQAFLGTYTVVIQVAGIVLKIVGALTVDTSRISDAAKPTIMPFTSKVEAKNK